MSLKSDYRYALNAYKKAEKEGNEEHMRLRAHDLSKIAEAMEGED